MLSKSKFCATNGKTMIFMGSIAVKPTLNSETVKNSDSHQAHQFSPTNNHLPCFATTTDMVPWTCLDASGTHWVLT